MVHTKLESDLFKVLLPFRGQRLLIALSGGRDSIVLIHCIWQIAERLKLEIGAAHVHHGLSPNDRQLQFRNQALEFSCQVAKDLQFKFFSSRVADELTLSGEAACRKFRHSELEKIRKRENFDLIVYAHHAGDLLETRLMRLLRGTGSGGLRAMQLRSGFKLRPFLKKSSVELSRYARDKKLSWLEDPSNLDSRFLRNWLRNDWLPKLERHRPGSLRALTRSLEQLTQDLKSRELIMKEHLHPSGGLDRIKIGGLSIVDKQKLIVAYMHRAGGQNFSAAQVDEVIKRLTSVQKNLTFHIAGLTWLVNAQRIIAEA